MFENIFDENDAIFYLRRMANNCISGDIYHDKERVLKYKALRMAIESLERQLHPRLISLDVNKEKSNDGNGKY